MTNYLVYDWTTLDNDETFEMIENDIEHYLNIEKDYLTENGITIINVDYKNHQFQIQESNINNNLYVNIPYNLINIGNNEEISEKNYNKNNNTKEDIVNYLKSRKIKVGNIKENIIEFSCHICNKDNDKCFIFKNSYHIMTHSKTDCDDSKHHEEWARIKQDLKDIEWDKKDLDQTHVKWDSKYVIVNYEDERGNKVSCKLSEYYEKYKDVSKPPLILKRRIFMCKENIISLMKHYRMEVKLNEIHKEHDVYINNKYVGVLGDYIRNIRDKFTKRGLSINKCDLEDNLYMISKENEYNPVRDYLTANYRKKDSTLRSDKRMFQRLCKSIRTSTGKVEHKLKKFLLQMVHMVLRDEKDQTDVLRAQYILILQGPQNSGKSTFLQNLIPPKLRIKYFKEARSMNVDDKDRIYESVTSWLVELSEIESTFKKSDISAFKQFITQTKDQLRLPYAKNWLSFKRRVCFSGTTNDYDYLRDLTGNRRFMCFNDTEINKNLINTVNIDDVWCYIYDCYLAGESFNLTDDDIEEFELENHKHVGKKDSLIFLEEYLSFDGDGDWYKIRDLWKYVQKVSGYESDLYFKGYINFGKELSKLTKTKFSQKTKSKLYRCNKIVMEDNVSTINEKL